MSRYLFITVLVVVLVSCTNNREGIEYLEYQIDSVSNFHNMTQKSYRYSYIMQLDRINPDVAIIDKNLDTCNLRQIIMKSDRIYFHYCDIHCSVCLDKQLTILREFESDNGANSLCIIASVQSYRSMLNLIMNYHFECKIYALFNQQSIFMNHPHFTDPFYFTINKDGKISLFHFPLVDDSTTTKLFLETARTKNESIQKEL